MQSLTALRSLEAERWSTEDVCSWVSRLSSRFGSGATKEYVEIFRAFNISGQDLVTLTQDDLKDMRIQSAEHRRHLLRLISDLRAGRKGAAAGQASSHSTLARQQESSSDLDEISGSADEKTSLFRDNRHPQPKGDHELDLGRPQALQHVHQTLAAVSTGVEVAVRKSGGSQAAVPAAPPGGLSMRQMGRGTQDRSHAACCPFFSCKKCCAGHQMCSIVLFCLFVPPSASPRMLMFFFW